jgi:hypothetical protein
MTNPVGRPKIQLTDLPKDWKEWILREMGEGASLVEVYAYLDISDKTLKRLMDDNEDFFRTIKKGIKISESWWQNKGRKSLENKDFNYTGWYMNMRNRFGWADKKNIDVTTKGKPLLGGLSGIPIDDGDEEAAKAEQKD